MVRFDAFWTDFSKSEAKCLSTEIIAKITFGFQETTKNILGLSKNILYILQNVLLNCFQYWAGAWVGHLSSLSGLHVKGPMLATRIFLRSQSINNLATVKFKVETFYNYYFAHWGQNLMEAGKSARTGGIEVKLEYQLDYQTTRLISNRVSVN